MNVECRIRADESRAGGSARELMHVLARHHRVPSRTQRRSLSGVFWAANSRANEASTTAAAPPIQRGNPGRSFSIRTSPSAARVASGTVTTGSSSRIDAIPLVFRSPLTSKGLKLRQAAALVENCFEVERILPFSFVATHDQLENLKRLSDCSILSKSPLLDCPLSAFFCTSSS